MSSTNSRWPKSRSPRYANDVFRQFNAPVEFSGDPIVGPAFLRFPVRAARGIRPEAIRKLSTALQVHLGLKTLPFIHNPGGWTVVDVERSDREIVPFSSVCDQLPAQDPVAGCSKLPVGVDLERKLMFADLADSANCHLRVAGATGSGKNRAAPHGHCRPLDDQHRIPSTVRGAHVQFVLLTQAHTRRAR
jgi:DNA segregation ATPase FtsK/SpoIIIE-like protein